MSTPVRPNVLAMHPYQPGKPISTVKRELGLKEVHKLASNENPFGPSPKALEAMRAALGEAHLYPDGAAFELRNALAVRFGLPMNQIAVGNGSDELIGHIALALVQGPDDEILTAQHSFPRYDAAAGLAGCRLVKTPLTSDWRYNLNLMAEEITERTRLIYIANPNNPTGTVVNRQELDAFLERVPDEILVVLDEAYFEFARHQTDYPDGRSYLLAGKNVAVLRTFSKAFGLAGIRVGYAFLPEYLAHALDRVRAPFHVNSLALAAGQAALYDDAHLHRTLENNREGLALLRLAFEREGCPVPESFTNFLFVDLGRSAEPVFKSLLEKGYIVRTLPGLPNHLRVTVGTPDENQGLILALRQTLAG